MIMPADLPTLQRSPMPRQRLSSTGDMEYPRGCRINPAWRRRTDDIFASALQQNREPSPDAAADVGGGADGRHDGPDRIELRRHARFSHSSTGASTPFRCVQYGDALRPPSTENLTKAELPGSRSHCRSNRHAANSARYVPSLSQCGGIVTQRCIGPGSSCGHRSLSESLLKLMKMSCSASS